MKKIKQVLTVCLSILALAALSATVFAASAYSTQAEVVAGITGRTTESVLTERIETGKTFGTIASEAGKLDEFKAEILEIKKDALNAQVAAGRITQERADAILLAIEENQALCDGTGTDQCLGTNVGSCGAGLETGICTTNGGFGVGKGQGGCGRGRGGFGL